MATRFSNKALEGVPTKGFRPGGNTVVATWSVGVVSNASIASAGDIIRMVKVPAGATVTYVGVSGGSGTMIYTVGDTVAPARYINSLSGSAAQTLQLINTVYVPYTYSVDSYIDINVSTVSTASLVGGFNMVVHFAMDA